MSRKLGIRRGTRRFLRLESLESRTLLHGISVCVSQPADSEASDHHSAVAPLTPLSNPDLSANAAMNSAVQRETTTQTTTRQTVTTHTPLPRSTRTPEVRAATVQASTSSTKAFVLDANGDRKLDVKELNRWLQWWQARQSETSPVAPTPKPAPKPQPTVLPNVADYGGPRDEHLNQVNAPEAWAAGHTGDGVVVAVIDTGADLSHSELRGSLWRNADETPGNGRDDDGNGLIDDVYGWDFVNDDNRPQDVNGHGTHVASLIVGARDGAGSTGVAPGAQLMVLQGLGADGVGDTRDVAAAVRYAVDEGADIINLSLSGAASRVLNDAIRYAESQGVLVVAAAGNQSAASPSAPATLSGSLTNVLSVGAVTSDNQAASFSNRHAGDVVQVYAPGVSLRAAVPGGYASYSGTSMATPVVAGVAALALSAAPDATAEQIRAWLVDEAISDMDESLLVVDAATTVARAIDFERGFEV